MYDTSKITKQNVEPYSVDSGDIRFPWLYKRSFSYKFSS